MGVDHHLNLVLVASLHFSLVFQQLFISGVIFNFFVLDILLEVMDFFVLFVQLLLDICLITLLLDLDLVFQVFNVGLVLVSFLFFDEDFIRLIYRAACVFLLVIFEVENTEDTILTSREEIVVVIG